MPISKYIPNKTDASGNSNWQEGQYVTAGNMNHIEDGVASSYDYADQQVNVAKDTLKTLTGSGDPTTSTAGTVGQKYLNTATKDIFICVNTTESYTWKKLYKWNSTDNKYYLVDADGDQIDVSAINADMSEIIEMIGSPYDNTVSYVTGDLVTYNEKLYRCKINGTGYAPTDTTHWEEINIANILEEKANIDGYYSTLGVGYADNLLSPDGIYDTPENDPEYNPFLLRTTAGSQSVSDGLVNIEVYGNSSKTFTESLNSIIQNIRNNLGSQEYPSGTQFQFKYNNQYDCPMNVVDHHDAIAYENGAESTIKALWTEWEYSIPSDIVFDPPEAMATISGTGLPVDTYYFKIAGDSWGSKNGKIYQFTTTTTLTSGMQLKPDGSYNSTAISNILVYANGKATSASYTFSCTETSSPSGVNLGTLWGTDMAASIKNCFQSDDGTHYLNHYHRIYLGYNEWRFCYIRQYLNAIGTGWWQSQNCWDRAPSGVDSVEGFFGTLPASLRQAIKTIKVYNLANSVTGDGGEYYTYDKIFLHTKKQMAWQQDGTETHNYEWEYYRELANKVLGGTTNVFANYTTYPALIKYSIQNHNTARYIWSSGALRSYGSSVWLVISSGSTASYGALDSYGCAPAYVLG